MRTLRSFFLLLACLAIAGCGGVSHTTSSPPPPGGGGGTGGGGNVSAPRSISVSGGGTTSGINIAVVAPSGTAGNIEVLGVTTGSGGSAFNTGAVIHRGETATVLTFGKGLTGTPNVSISGPSDITVSGINSIKATDGTPGVAFTAAVNGSAALGARTVRMIDTSNNITTFTGGLEVVR